MKGQKFRIIAWKAKKVVDSVETPKQIEAARRYVQIACNEMMNDEYYLKGSGDALFNATAHLFVRLDEMQAMIY